MTHGHPLSRVAALTAAGMLCVALSPVDLVPGSRKTRIPLTRPAVAQVGRWRVGNGRCDRAAAQRLPAGSNEAKGRCGHSRPAPHITIENVPPNLPVSWLLNQRVELIVNLTLLALVYIGVMIAIRVLSKIRRRLQETEVTVQSVAGEHQQHAGACGGHAFGGKIVAGDEDRIIAAKRKRIQHHRLAIVADVRHRSPPWPTASASWPMSRVFPRLRSTRDTGEEN